MTPSVTQRPGARLDLLQQFIYFAEQGGLDLAERYYASVDATCALLLKFPRSGVRYPASAGGIPELRRVPVTGFEHLLIFYTHHRGGIDVVRVLHAARDIDNLLADEDPSALSS